MNANREVAVKMAAGYFRAQAAQLRAGYDTVHRAVLMPAVVKLTVLADQVESPSAPAWLVDMAEAGMSRVQMAA